MRKSEMSVQHKVMTDNFSFLFCKRKIEANTPRNKRPETHRSLIKGHALHADMILSSEV